MDYGWAGRSELGDKRPGIASITSFIYRMVLSFCIQVFWLGFVVLN